MDPPTVRTVKLFGIVSDVSIDYFSSEHLIYFEVVDFRSSQ